MDQEPLHRRIAGDIERRIASGEWRPGFRIPTEAELTAEYGCARMTVSRAMSDLAARGLVVRRRRADADFEQRVLDGIGRGPDAFALEAELGNISAPTLLLWCREDKVIDISAAEVIAKGLPQSRTVILSGCGHMPMMAQPRNVAEALRDFL